MTNPNIIRIFLIFVTLIMSFQIQAQSGPARMALEQFSQDLETLQARFEQMVIGRGGSVEAESEGQLWLRRPDHFRWEYGGDFPEVVIADGSTVWLYDEVLEQVTLKNQSNLSTDTPLMLLTDLTRLDEQFVVRELGGDSGIDILELESKNTEAEFERILLGFDENGLVLMAMEDAFGLRTEIRLHDIVRNEALEDTLFKFEIPPGTDVVGALTGMNSEE